MKVLITGITGFQGSHLAQLCRTHGATVAGFSRRTGIDILDSQAVAPFVATCSPDVIFHLAGLTSGIDEDDLHRTNVRGTRNIIEAAAGLVKTPLVIVATSGAIYGGGPRSGSPISEAAPPAPVTPYAKSKVEQDAMAKRLGLEVGVPVIRARPFNQIGPGLPETFVASSIAHQIAEIEGGRREPKLQIGRTDTVRDFSDIRDVARGYWLLARRGRAQQAYNLCSGRGVAISSLLHRLLAMSQTRIHIERKIDEARSIDVPISIGDREKVRRDTGWKPHIALGETLQDTLNYWRCFVRRT